MESDEFQALLFHSCADLRGEVRRIEVGKRNGRLCAFFGPEWSEGPAELDQTEPLDLIEVLCENLNRDERRIWMRLMDGCSLRELAREEGVSRSALYFRLRGRRGRGGMIAKNRYVAAWWAQCQERHHGSISGKPDRAAVEPRRRA
ncbi:MAG: hypothetical protein ABFD89_29865 [Bryobacteraceae bacterium]